MTTQFGVIRAVALAMALSASGASIALADSATDAKAQAGTSTQQVAQGSETIVPNNGLCNAQFGVPMADCDRPHAMQQDRTGAAGNIDYLGFPYNLLDSGAG
jgi:hypothetical protein